MGDSIREVAEQIARSCPRLPCGAFEATPGVDTGKLATVIEEALRAERERALKESYLVVWCETSASEFEDITGEVFRGRVLEKLKKLEVGDNGK